MPFLHVYVMLPEAGGIKTARNDHFPKLISILYLISGPDIKSLSYKICSDEYYANKYAHNSFSTMKTRKDRCQMKRLLCMKP